MMKTSSSRIDSEILTLISPFENFFTVQGVRGTLRLGVCHSRRGGTIVWGGLSSPLSHGLGELGVTVPCESNQHSAPLC